MRKDVDIGLRFVGAGLALWGATGCNGVISSTEVQKKLTDTKTLEASKTSTPTHTLKPTQTPTRTLTPTFTPTFTRTPTRTPDYKATQEVQWGKIVNSEKGDKFQLINPEVTRIIRYFLDGESYWVEINNGLTAFQSDCIKEALEKKGELGEQKSEGIWEPKAKLDEMTGKIKFSSNIIGSLLKPIGIKTPFVDLTEVKNEGESFNCDVETTDEAGKAGLREIFEAAKPQLEKVYPRVKQVGRIFGMTLDLIEQKVKSKLTPQPVP